MVALSMERKILFLPWAKLIADPRCQARANISPETVQEYADARKAGSNFPPGVAFHDGCAYYLADGFTRRLMYKRLREKGMTVMIRPGNIRDAILFAVSANLTHGARMTDDDKRRAARILLTDPEWTVWSNCEIARRCGVSEGLVRTERRILVLNEDAQPTRRVTRNGTTYNMRMPGREDDAARFEEADARARSARERDKWNARLAKCEKTAKKLRRLHAAFGDSAADGLESIDGYLETLAKLK